MISLLSRLPGLVVTAVSGAYWTLKRLAPGTGVEAIVVGSWTAVVLLAQSSSQEIAQAVPTAWWKAGTAMAILWVFFATIKRFFDLLEKLGVVSLERAFDRRTVGRDPTAAGISELKACMEEVRSRIGTVESQVGELYRDQQARADEQARRRQDEHDRMLRETLQAMMTRLDLLDERERSRLVEGMGRLARSREEQREQ